MADISDEQWLLSLPEVPKCELDPTHLRKSIPQLVMYSFHLSELRALLPQRDLFFREQGKQAASISVRTHKLYSDLSEGTRILAAKGVGWARNLSSLYYEACLKEAQGE